MTDTTPDSVILECLHDAVMHGLKRDISMTKEKDYVNIRMLMKQCFWTPDSIVCNHQHFVLRVSFFFMIASNLMVERVIKIKRQVAAFYKIIHQ